MEIILGGINNFHYLVIFGADDLWSQGISALGGHRGILFFFNSSFETDARFLISFAGAFAKTDKRCL